MFLTAATPSVGGRAQVRRRRFSAESEVRGQRIPRRRFRCRSRRHAPNLGLGGAGPQEADAGLRVRPGRPRKERSRTASPTSERIAVELGELLKRAHLPPPYLLVGHSFGGLNVRLYAARNPDQVAGPRAGRRDARGLPRDRGLPKNAGRAREAAHRTCRGAARFRGRARRDRRQRGRGQGGACSTRHSGRDHSAAHHEDSPKFRSTWAHLAAKDGGLVRERQSRFRRCKSEHYVQFDEPELIISAVTELGDGGAVPASRDPRGSSDSP